MIDISRKEGALLGAYVGDAASLGFHWLYEPSRIRELAPETPEFREPSAADFEGAAGFFAATGKSAGDLSHYGAQLDVALRSLVATRGDWNPFHYQARFCQTFDRGGSFTGYIDTATGLTIDNVASATDKLLSDLIGEVGGLDEKQAGYVKRYTAKKGLEHRGPKLAEAVAGIIGMVFEDDAVTEKAKEVARLYDQRRTARLGGEDNQLPAVAKLPVVVGRFAGQEGGLERTLEAIEVTNRHPEALSFGRYAAAALERVILGESVRTALESAREVNGDAPEVEKRLDEAFAAKVDDLEALGEQFGMACPLPSAIPLAVAILKEAPDYVTGIRQNLYAGGDNAGRAVWLGAMLGAANGIGGTSGIPLAWVGKLADGPRLLGDVSAVARY